MEVIMMRCNVVEDAQRLGDVLRRTGVDIFSGHRLECLLVLVDALAQQAADQSGENISWVTLVSGPKTRSDQGAVYDVLNAAYRSALAQMGWAVDGRVIHQDVTDDLHICAHVDWSWRALVSALELDEAH